MTTTRREGPDFLVVGAQRAGTTWLGAESLHGCFFEELRDRPAALTEELLRFLGVPSIALPPPQAVNVAAGSKAVPLAFARATAADAMPTLERLCRRFDGAPRAWRARYLDLLDVDRR